MTIQTKMGLGKKTIKLVKKVLKDKRDLYTDVELSYMEMQLGRMIETRKRRKIAKKQQQGFGNHE